MTHDICAVEHGETAKVASQWVQDTLRQAGLVANEAKCAWTPSTVVQWLGFKIDLSKGCASVPDEKITVLKSTLRAPVRERVLCAKYVASLVGKIISMGIALGPIARFITRELYALLQERYSWCDRLTVSPGVRSELEFWYDLITDYNSQPIWHSPSAVRFAYSDASNTGYGGYMVEHGLHVAQGNWSPKEAQQSSTWRELVATGREGFGISCFKAW